MDDNEEEDEKNFMWEHMKSFHHELIDKHDPGNYEKAHEVFEFRITGRYMDAMTRQITELVRIRMALNKGEIGGEKGEKKKVKILECMNSREEQFAPYERRIVRNSWKNKKR